MRRRPSAAWLAAPLLACCVASAISLPVRRSGGFASTQRTAGMSLPEELQDEYPALRRRCWGAQVRAQNNATEVGGTEGKRPFCSQPFIIGSRISSLFQASRPWVALP